MAGLTDNEHVTQALNQVIKAINDKQFTANITIQGGGGSAPGCGCGIPEDTIIDPPAAPPLGDEETDPPPDGFDDWSEYHAYKCRAANKIVDDLISTCSNLSSIPGVVSGMGAGLLYLVISAAFFASGPTAIATGLIALGLASAAGVAIAITALVLIILAGIGGLAYFTSLASALSDAKSDIVCALYDAQSVEEARGILLTAVDDAITGIEGITEFLSDKINSVISALLGTAVFNTLFEPNESVADYVGTINCNSCNACELTFPDASWGSSDAPLLTDGELRTITPAIIASGGFAGQYVLYFTGGCECRETGVRVEIVDLTGYDAYSGGGSGDSGDKGGLIADCASAELWGYADSVAPSGSYCGVNSVQLGPQTTPFELQVRIYADDDCL